MKMKARKLIALVVICAFSFGAVGANNYLPIQAKQTKKIKKIKLNYAKKTLVVGESFKLKVKKVKPKKASRKVRWKSSNKKIATVSKKGVVLAKKKGTVKIMAVSKKRKKVKAFCKVTVTEKQLVTTSKVKKPANGQGETTLVVETTKAEETTPAVETTKSEETTPVVETTKPEETTPAVETTKPEETTPAVETTKPEETTAVVETTKPEETTPVVETTTPEETTNQQINVPNKPEGLACASASENAYYFVWQASEGATSYNFYIDNNNVASGLTIYAYLYSGTLSAGEHTIGVSAVNESGESEIAEMKYVVKESETNPTTFTVTFKDYDGRVLKTEEVESGKNATAPEQPTRNGFRFVSWDKPFTNVEDNIIVTAMYEDITVPLIYGDNVEINIESESETIVPVCIKNNPGVLGMTLSVSFDESRFSLTGYEIGDAVKGILTLTGSNVLNSGCKFVYDGQDLASENIKDGQILLLKFKKKVGIWSSATPITISYVNGDIIDYNLNPISFMIQSGSISIK